jgi:hypothetical protein
MATNKKISDLDTAGAIDGSEMIPVVKGGSNFKILISQIKNWLGVASTANDGLMAATDKQKLSGIQSNATQNATDAQLRDRSTHTGMQAANTITGLKTVATSGVYSDLTGRPDLSVTALGAAPATHVGKGGIDQHPIATVDQAGFMSPATVELLESAKPIAFSADYSDLLNSPWIRVAPQGFAWWPNSDTPKGETHNDYASFGTGAYHGLAATGSKYKDCSEYHAFTSAAATYSIAGIRSAAKIVKKGNGPHQGGFLFEAIVHWTYTPGTCMVIGVTTDPDKAYGNWSGSDEGIAIGWNASDVGTTTIKAMAGNGVSTTRYNATAGTIADDATYAVRIELVPVDTTVDGVTRKAVVTVLNLDTGVKIIDRIEIPDAELPKSDTPLHCMVAYGTLTNTTAIEVDILAISCERYRGF